MNNATLYAFIASRYQHLDSLLGQFIEALQTQDVEKKQRMLTAIKEETNHKGIHLTQSELVVMFLGTSLRGESYDNSNIRPT